MAIIDGGYYIKARCYKNSEIAHASPCVREMWDWLISEANHEPRKCNGLIIQRGQCLRTFRDIQEGLHWMVGWRKMTYSKHNCEDTMILLRRWSMVATEKTTRGMLITILNYDKYQNPKNYESNKEGNMEGRDAVQEGDTINKNDNNNNNKTFDQFWSAYPRKVGKKAAMTRFGKIDPALHEALMTSLEVQKKSQQWQDERFIPHPTTWLNGERWNDEIVVKEETTQQVAERLVREGIARYGDDDPAYHWAIDNFIKQTGIKENGLLKFKGIFKL